MAEHYHTASKTLGGTWSRHYEPDLTEHDKIAPLAASVFEGTTPSQLTALGLEDYRCPEWIRAIALTDRSYSVWRRNVLDAERVMYHTAAFTLANAIGGFLSGNSRTRPWS